MSKNSDFDPIVEAMRLPDPPKKEDLKVQSICEPILEGTLFTVTMGNYSDYTVMGVFRALKKIDPDTLSREWFIRYPEQNKPYQFDACAFFEEVVRRGFLEAVPSREWHLADYHSPGEMYVEGPRERKR